MNTLNPSPPVRINKLTPRDYYHLRLAAAEVSLEALNLADALIKLLEASDEAS